MELNFLYRAFFFALLLTILSSFSSSSTFISDGVFEIESQNLVTGRHLLQAKKKCTVNFEFMNYTVITSQCKGPKYPAKECCSSFKEFACPYSEEINDLTTNCANTMFTYINIYGRYPGGLFANQCREGKYGLECPAPPPNSEAADINAASATACSHVLISIFAALLVVVLL